MNIQLEGEKMTTYPFFSIKSGLPTVEFKLILFAGCHVDFQSEYLLTMSYLNSSLVVDCEVYTTIPIFSSA